MDPNIENWFAKDKCGNVFCSEKAIRTQMPVRQVIVSRLLYQKVGSIIPKVKRPPTNRPASVR
jgi:hypothetical protein